MTCSRRQVLAATHGLLASSHTDAPFAAEWPAGPPSRTPAPATLPVLRWLPETARSAPAKTRAVAAALLRAAPTMSWRQSYSAAQVGAEFLEKYGWTELVGLTGPVASERLAAGFLLLGPGADYPRHRHEAEEIYIPLSGHAQFTSGDGVWRTAAPGAVIHHASEEPHAIRSGERPLLALYVWRSENLQQKSRLD